MNQDPQLNARDFSEALDELRDEMRRDIRALTQAVDRRPVSKPGVSLLAAVAGFLCALFVGAAGMAWYESGANKAQDSTASPVDVPAELKIAMTPYTQKLEEVSVSLESAQQAAIEDSKANGLLLDQLAASIAGLEESAATRNAAFQERVDLLADELVAKLSRGSIADTKPTIAARPTTPNSNDSEVKRANAETDVTDTESNLVEVEKRPTTSETDEPERGELVIRNPSTYDLSLLINGEPLEIKARGVTTIDVTIGAVKTQIAGIPDLVQDWNDWKTVDGVRRLTINVESGDGYYKLR